MQKVVRPVQTLQEGQVQTQATRNRPCRRDLSGRDLCSDCPDPTGDADPHRVFGGERGEPHGIQAPGADVRCQWHGGDNYRRGRVRSHSGGHGFPLRDPDGRSGWPAGGYRAGQCRAQRSADRRTRNQAHGDVHSAGTGHARHHLRPRGIGRGASRANSASRTRLVANSEASSGYPPCRCFQSRGE